MARRRETAARTAQAVGGTAETMRTGVSAAETFARREPQYDTMSQKEKLAAQQPLVESLRKEETFYYGKALERELSYMAEQEKNYRAALQAAAQKYATMTSAAKARAQLQTRRLEHDIGLLRADKEKMLTASPQSQAEFNSLAAGVDAELAQEKAQIVQALKAANPDASAAEIEAAADQVVDATVPAKMVELVDGVTQGKEPGQARAIMQLMGSRYGVSMDDMKAAPGGERLEALDAEVARLVEANVEEADTKRAEWAQRAGQTFGGSREMDRLMAHGEQGAVRRQATPVRGEAAPAVGTRVPRAEAPAAAEAFEAGAEEVRAGPVGGPPVAPGAPAGVAYPRTPADPSLEPYRPPEAGEPVEAFDVEQQQQEAYQLPEDSIYGLPIKPAGTAAERTLQMLDLIEQYPEHPPLQQTKEALMSDPKFQQYKKDRGYEDDSFAFREMRREYGAQRRRTVKSDREARRRNVDEGVVPARGRKERKVRPPSTPVHGAVSRTPAEVKSGDR